jgi:hypothetical protein
VVTAPAMRRSTCGSASIMAGPENVKLLISRSQTLRVGQYSGQYKREREDYKQLCPSCYCRMDMKDMCRQGHLYTKTNTHVTSRGIVAALHVGKRGSG